MEKNKREKKEGREKAWIISNNINVLVRNQHRPHEI